jgi:peptide/nickel transport system substrate-binding protein
VLAAVALGLSACASDSGGDQSSGDSASTAPVTFTWGYEQEFSGYNIWTADQYTLANGVVMQQVINGFWQFGEDGSVVPNKEFGTYEKTSDNPLTVKYTFDPKAAWSDGNPLDCDDAVLVWLANSGKSGSKGFSAVSTTGYEDNAKPTCKDGDKSFTIVYDKPYADWSSAFGPSGGNFLPAHILEKESGVSDIITAADDPKGADSLKAAAVYNKIWNFNPGELKPAISPSAGPYQLSKWDAGQSLTLTANPKWWGTPPKSQTIVLRYLAPNAMAQALQNGEINAMDPQPQVDLVNQLKALGNQVKFSTSDQFSFEHLDFNFTGAFKDRDLREAFAKCVPRQQIIDNLIKPVNPEAKIFQSRFIFPFQDAYSQFETGVGGNAYDKTDIPGAKQLVDKAGKGKKVRVRIGWRKDPQQLNKRRADTIALIQASCNQAGFNVVDAGTADFFENAWPAGNFDVAMFAWSGSSLVSGNTSIYKTGGGQNPGKYSNKSVDDALSAVNQELDVDKQTVLLKQMDTTLWKDLATIPLFAFPAVVATSTNAEGVVYNPTQADLSWNSQEWSLKQ